jgi:NAD(P)H dehydrogenase (quinone)
VEPWSGYLGEKRGMLIMTSSYEASSFREERVGELRDVLHPVLYGTLAYTGMQVLDPFIAYAADSVDDDTRRGYLAELSAQLESLPSARS